MPRIRENSRLERTHDRPKSPDPIFDPDTDPEDRQDVLDSTPKRRHRRGAPKNLYKILEDNNWDSVVDLIFRRKDDSPVLDALNSFGLEFGLPIMRALDVELSKDLIYSDEEEILPAEPEDSSQPAVREAPVSQEEAGKPKVADKPKELVKEEKRAEKNKRKKQRRKERKHEWKKKHSANDMSVSTDDEEQESKEEESKEEENTVEKTSEDAEQASPESSATLTEIPATGVDKDIKTTEEASPESSVAVAKTGDAVENLHEALANKKPDKTWTFTNWLLGHARKEEDPSAQSKEVDKDSLDVSTAGSPVENQLDETPKLVDETPKLVDETPKLEDKGEDDSSPVVHVPEEKKSVQEKAETEETELKKDPEEKSVQEKAETELKKDPEEKSLQKKAETELKKDPEKKSAPVKAETELKNDPEKSLQEKAGTELKKDPEKKSVLEKAETDLKKDPEKKSVQEKAETEEAKQEKVPEENKSVQEKAEAEETKLKKGSQIVKQKIKPSKSSDDNKETIPSKTSDHKETMSSKTSEDHKEIMPPKTSDHKDTKPTKTCVHKEAKSSKTCVHKETKPSKTSEDLKETKPSKTCVHKEAKASKTCVHKDTKPSKTSEDHKETNNIERCREMEESSVPSPLPKGTAIGGFSDNGGTNDDLEPRVRNKEVVAEDLARKSTELAAVGNRYAACGQYEAAVKCYTDAIKYNPQEFKLFGNRSLCYERMRDYERALADARLALFMEPKWLKGLFRKGKALCGLKRYFEASLVYKEILEQESSSAEAAQELKRAQTLHLMEMGFTWGQSSEALKNHATLEEAIDALFGSDGKHRRSGGRRSQSAEDDVSQDKRNRQMEETEDEDKKKTAAANSQPSVQKVKVNTPTSIDRTRTKSQSPTPREGAKTSRDNHNCDLWVGSLAPTVTKMKLYTIFGRAGTVSNVTMISNQQYAFIKFTRKEDCDRAINMLNGMVVEGSPLLVRPSNKSRF